MASSSHSRSAVGGTTVGSILLYTKNGSSPCYDITVEPFEEVGDDKGLSKNESDSFCKMYEIVNKQMIF